MKEKLKINFLIVGTQKGGTTSLRYYLSAHPEIYIHPTKECKFFIIEEYYKKGREFLISKWFPDLYQLNNEYSIGLIEPDIMFF